MGVVEANTKKQTDARHSQHVDKGDVAHVNGIPIPEAPVNVGAQWQHRVQVPKIGEQQADEKGFPDFDVWSGAQD